MANTTLSLTSLDFNTLKSSFQAYLVANTIFKDYNFNSSSLNVELDILAYNSYLNSFYLNMVMSEMFLDSAQNLNSVVSHVKELNYLPRSSSSSSANLSFTATVAGSNGILYIPPNINFIGTNSNGTFTYSTSGPSSYTSSNSTFVVDNLIIYEGLNTLDTFIIDTSQDQLIYTLSNQNIDVNSIVVTIFENNSGISQNGTVYTRVNNLFGLTSTSKIYFIQAAQNGQYEIALGDGVLGYIPPNNSLATISYRIASGSAADGISSFAISQDLSQYNTGSVGSIGIINTSPSYGGSNQESIASIKYNAPRYFATQERGISTNDYSSLVIQQFGGTIADVSVYGGETLNPKQYGRIALCLRPTGTTVTPDYLKTQVVNYLKTLGMIPFRVIITDPDYFYCTISANIKYSYMNNVNTTNVLNSIINYGNDNLGIFNSQLRYSKLVAAIDNSDSNIISNDTSMLLVKRIAPIFNTSTSYTVNYNNSIAVQNTTLDVITPIKNMTEPSFWSSVFTYIDNSGNIYPNACMRDDNFGNIIVYNININNNIKTIINTNIGTINYITGLVQINSLLVNGFNTNYIALYAKLQDDDITAVNNQILLIDPNDITISTTMVS
jgi:hypothetical protein